MDPIKNFAEATLVAGIASGAVVAEVEAGDAAYLPTGGQWAGVLWNFTDYGNDRVAAYKAGQAEVVLVTRTVAELALVRGQDGSTARDLNTLGKTYKIAQDLTAGLFAKLAALVHTHATSDVTGLDTALNLKAPAAAAALTGNTSVDRLSPNIHDLGTVASGTITLDATKSVSKVVLTGTALTVAFPAGGARVQQALLLSNTNVAAATITIPSSKSGNRGSTITTFVVPAGETATLSWIYDGAVFHILGDPLTAAQAKAALVLVAADLSDFNSASRAQTEAELLAGTGITITPASSGATRTLTIASTGGAIATDTLWDAAGDLAVGTGANTAARLAMGSALQILRVNAGATGLEYVAPGAGSGDVTAAAAFATDNVIVRADGTGKGVQASSVRITDAGDVEVYGDSIPGSLRLADGDATDPEVVTLTAPVDITTSFTLVLPADAPTALQQLRQNSANTALEFFTPVPLVGALTCSIPAANAANQTIYADAKAAFGYTINSILGAGTSSGSITLAVKINGTDVTGLAAVAITSTPADTNASAANVVAVGDIVTWVFSSNSSANNLRFTQKITRT